MQVMSHFQLEPEASSGSLSRTLLFGLLFIAAFLAFVGTLVVLNNSELAFGPTPTPTATSRLPTDATPDFRATRHVEDQLTAQVYQVAQSTATGPIDASTEGTSMPGDAGEGSVEILPERDGATAAPAPPDQSTESEPQTPAEGSEGAPAEAPAEDNTGSGETTVNLPVVISGSQGTVEATAEAEDVPQPTPSPTETATETPVPTATEAPPTATPFLPSPTPALPTPTFTPQLSTIDYTVDSLKAFVDANGAIVREGPGANYNSKGEFGPEIEVKLLGRTRSGEWVYACCVDNEPGWIRQIEAPPSGNEFRDNPPENADPNDVRWLRVQSIDSSLEPLPIATTIPIDDFPLARYDRANRAKLATFPVIPVRNGWPNTPYETGSEFTSGVAVFGQSVVAANADNHIYSINRLGGNQRWRASVDAPVRFAPAIQDSTVYVVDEAGTVYAFGDSGNVATERWKQPLGMTPSAGINIAGGQLFVPGTTADAQRLYALNRDNGDRIHEFATSGRALGYPAIGDQLVYIAGDKLWALDINDINNRIWEYTEFTDYTVPPIYSDQGVLALAEIIIASNDGLVHIIDANTSRRKLSVNLEQITTGMAIDDQRIYTTSGTFINALDRRTLETAWTSALDSPAVDGPIAGPGQLVVFQESGAIIFFESAQGSQIGGMFIPDRIPGTGALSGQWIFTANTRGSLYGFTAAP